MQLLGLHVWPSPLMTVPRSTPGLLDMLKERAALGPSHLTKDAQIREQLQLTDNLIAQIIGVPTPFTFRRIEPRAGVCCPSRLDR